MALKAHSVQTSTRLGSRTFADYRSFEDRTVSLQCLPLNWATGRWPVLHSAQHRRSSPSLVQSDSHIGWGSNRRTYSRWQTTAGSSLRTRHDASSEESTWDARTQSMSVEGPEPPSATRENVGKEGEDLEGSFCLMNEGPGSCNFRLVALTEEHVPDMDALIRSVQFDPPVWEDFFQMDRRDVLGIWDCGTNDKSPDILAGIVSAVYYPKARHEHILPTDDRNPFGWIGNVAVHPDYRSRGLARVLLADAVHHLQTSRRCRALMLDASIMGKQVYDKLGFRDICLVHRMKIEGADLERAVEKLADGGVPDVENGGGSLGSNNESVSEVANEGEDGRGAPGNSLSGNGSGRRKTKGQSAGLLASILNEITENDLGTEVTFAEVSTAAAAVELISDDDTWNAIVAWDGQVFGADRALLLRRWQRRHPECAVWLPNRGQDKASEGTSDEPGTSSVVGGPVRGYSFAHTRPGCHSLGPIVAGDGASAGALLLAQLREIAQRNREGDPWPCVVYLVEPPRESELGAGPKWEEYLAWSRFLEGLGFKRDGSTVRQVLGDAPDCPCLQHYFGAAALDFG